jgi:hypothetical protein
MQVRTQSAPVRVTGLQAALAALVAELERWRDQFGPREYAALLDVFGRWLEQERERAGRACRRCPL